MCIVVRTFYGPDEQVGVILLHFAGAADDEMNDDSWINSHRVAAPAIPEHAKVAAVDA
jgi:hypothetical protein